MQAKEFFGCLKEGEEYVSVLMTKETYNKMNKSVKESIVITSIRQLNTSFKDDENHKKLVSKVSKAKKELRNYEYDINNR